VPQKNGNLQIVRGSGAVRDTVAAENFQGWNSVPGFLRIGQNFPYMVKEPRQKARNGDSCRPVFFNTPLLLIKIPSEQKIKQKKIFFDYAATESKI
jgi:hypothetical protein